MTVEITHPPEGTPLGGVKLVTCYLDADGRECAKEDAAQLLVSEYDAEGRWLGETIARL